MAKKYISEKIRMKTEARLAAVQATYVIAVTENPVEEVIKDFVDGKVGRYVIAEKSMDKEEMVPVHEWTALILPIWLKACMPARKILKNR